MRVIAVSLGGRYLITDYPDWQRAFSDRGVRARVLDVDQRLISEPIHPVSVTKMGSWTATDDQPPELERWLAEFKWMALPERRPKRTGHEE